MYKDSNLVDVLEYQEMTSNVLLPVIENLLSKYDIKNIIYTNGPGSHMATKITYVLLKTLNIIKDIPILAVSGFELNGNKPIKALGKLYFIKEKETIITKTFDKVPQSTFSMPKNLATIKLESEIEPNYEIGAI